MLPIAYPAARSWQLPVFERHDSRCLREAWERSARTLARISGLLRHGPIDAAVRTIALSGSLGRMEQLTRSDVDLIVIVDEEGAADADRSRAAYESVWSCLEPLNCPAPKPDGIFAGAYDRRRFCRPEDRGTIAEDLATFGIRMQLLLDCQPVFGEREFAQLQEKVLDFYAGDWRPAGQPTWEYLVNDLIRYFRSMAVQGHWKMRDRPGAWRLRNLKRLHSRRILYAGLLFLLGESTRCREDPFEWVLERLPLTPLERLAEVYRSHDEPHFERVMGCYEAFLRSLDDSPTLARLESPEEAGDPARHPDYQALQENGQRMVSELTGFVWRRRGQWIERFLQQLLF